MMINSRCTYGCYCSNDDYCEYYCDRNNICQNSIPLWEKCSGYLIHRRECGTVSYCDPYSNYTCQLQKNYGQLCKYDYSCLSGNCDYKTNRCQLRTIFDIYPIVIPIGVIFFSVIIVVIIIVAVRRRRIHALTMYQNPYVVLPSTTPCLYQNSYMVGVGEIPPAAYSGVVTTPKSYQNSS